MLAGAYNEKNFKHIKYPALVQTKLDGMRANILMFDDGKVEVRSRNGKLLELHNHFDDYSKSLFYKGATLDNLSQFRDGVIDGELVVLSEDGTSVLDRKTGNGILNKAVKGTITKEDAKRVRMIAWDLIPMDDFKIGHSNVPYFDRLEVLGIRLEEAYNTSPDGDLIKLVPNIPVENIEQANELFQIALNNGEEGIILKNGDSPWEDKRSKYQVKMKAELEADLLVTAWNEGTGRIEGKMGSVTCVSADGGLEVNVGSGFNDEDREMVAEDIVGKIITVKYNEVIQDKRKSTKSLFLPIYIETRLDKSKADIL
jgi:ATP-dependent DNA ligase